MHWIDHLEAMAYIRSSVALRAYGQRDPLIEYQKEGRTIFEAMKSSILARVTSLIENIDEQAFKTEEERIKRAMKTAQRTGGDTSTALFDAPQYGRNDMITITKGAKEQTIKYKKAEPLLEEGWEIKK